MIDAHYTEVGGKFAKWQKAVRDPALARGIAPAMVTAAVQDDAEHLAHVSAAQYLAGPDTALNAPLFPCHALGLNQCFVGDGWAIDPLMRERVEEYLTGNVPLATVAEHRLIDLHVVA